MSAKSCLLNFFFFNLSIFILLIIIIFFKVKNIIFRWMHQETDASTFVLEDY